MPDQAAPAAEHAPADWPPGRWDAGATAVRALPHRVQVLLAVEWALMLNDLGPPPDWVPDPDGSADPKDRRRVSVTGSAALRTAAAWALYHGGIQRDTEWTRMSQQAAAAVTSAVRSVDTEARAFTTAYEAILAGVPQTRVRRAYMFARGPTDAIFDPAWRTADVVGLARAVATTRETDLLGVLADALEEAGCTHPALLAQLRTPDPDHTRASWAVWQALDLTTPIHQPQEPSNAPA